MDFERFCELAARGGLVPVWRDVLLDAETPVSAFHKLLRGPFGFLLESAPAGGETWSRYTFMGTEPRSAWRLMDGVVTVWNPQDGWHGEHAPDDPLEDLRSRLRSHTPVEVAELGAFWSGAVGYFAYDIARLIEHLPHAPPRASGAPDALFVFTGVVVIMDNLRSQARAVVGVPVPPGATVTELRAAFDAACGEIGTTIERLRSPTETPLPPLDLSESAAPAVGTSVYAKQRFLRDVERVREYILAGDCFQALLARRITVKHDFASESLYRALRALNPSPYMYHLVLDGVELVGSSPELLVRLANDRVTVRPIAGTRPRGATAEQDELLARELLADEKERAEHVMLVDLGRNDVGRIASFGSVQVTDLMRVEKYSHVLHIVSQVEGMLAEGASAMDVFRATFPAGTMTGAPKVRAMQIIDELEPERRGPYAGAVGYIAAGDRRMDLAITIRTCVITGGEASVQAGAGIVADSVPEREWEETENKARAILTAIGRVRASAHTRSRMGAVTAGRANNAGVDPAGGRPDNMMAFKLVSESSGQEYHLPDGATLVVGRGAGCDVMVLNPNISRRHAQMHVAPGQVELRDLGSSNGTFLNGERSEHAVARPGDLITFGTAAFRLEEAGSQARRNGEESGQRGLAPGAGERAALDQQEPRKMDHLGKTLVRKLDKLDIRTIVSNLSAAAESSLEVLHTSDDLSQTAPRSLRRQLDALLAVAAELLKERDVAGMMRRVADQAAALLNADRVAVLLADRAGGLHQVVARSADGAPVEKLVPTSIARRALQERVAILTANAGEDVRFTGESVRLQLVRSAMCVPLFSESGALGVIYVDSITESRAFGDEDLDLLLAFAGIVAAAVEREQLAERLRREAVVRSSFERYFAPALAQRIVDAPEKVRLGGERTTVAVLFSDIRGFTAWSEKLPAEETAKILSEYFGEMVECVFATGGTLDKFIGDALMAQWGAPLSTGADAANALKTARLMHERLAALNARGATEQRPVLEIGIGIGYGEVFAGNIGAAKRLEYTVIGDVVNVASRLASLAAPGEVLISGDARDSMGSAVEGAEELEQLQVRGRTRNVRVFRVHLTRHG